MKISQAIKDTLNFGYMTEKEFLALAKLANDAGPKARLVNIGAGAGTSSLALAIGSPSDERYSVDRSANGPLGGLEGERNAFDKTEYPYPIQILGLSHAVGAAWNKGEIDLLFVDGDHSATGLNADLNAWLPHVKKGGIIALHDYGSNDWPDVKMIVDYRFKRKKPLVHVDYLIAFRK